MMHSNDSLTWENNPTNKIFVRHVIRLKQCTTASVVSRLLKQGDEHKMSVAAKQPLLADSKKINQDGKTPRGTKVNISPRYDISSESASRRSRVIEMSHQGAERILEREQPTRTDPIHPKVRVEEIKKQEIPPKSARRHFRLHSRDPRTSTSDFTLANIRSPCIRAVSEKHIAEDGHLFEKSISVVKSTVEGNIANDVDIAVKSAGMFECIFIFHFTADEMSSIIRCA